MNPPERLTAKSLRAVKWNYLGTVGRVVLQFGSQIALARLIGPDAIGMFGYALLTIGLFAIVLEMGLGASLVQVPELEDRALATVCGRLLFSGTLVAIAVFASADALATYVFFAPQAAPIIRAMAPSLMIAAAMFPATAILKRQIEFKAIQLAELGSYVLGYVIVGVTAAWHGMGEWSLVLAWYVQTGVACLLLYARAPRSLLPGNPFHKLSLSGFGIVVMFTNMLNWTIEYGTHVIIGRFYGALSLGEFTLSNNLVRTPANHLVTNLQLVLFPIAARSQGNDAGLRRAYLTVLGGITFVAFPVFGYVAVMASPIVAALLGSKWAGAAQVLTPLSLAMIPHVAMAICGPILNGRGNPYIELRAQTATVVILSIAMLIASRWSLATMGWTLAAIYLIRYLWMTNSLIKILCIPIDHMLQTLRGPGLLGLISVSCSIGTVAAAFALGIVLPPILELMVAAFLAAAAIALTIWLAPAWVLGPHLRSLVCELAANRPALSQLRGFQHLFGSKACGSN